jgi:hypothetical protein
MIAQLKRIIRKVMPMEYIFNKIYRTHRFGGTVSASGPGSDMKWTEAIRGALPELVKEYNIKTMFDAPCGDFYWMRDTNLDLDKYIGADIVLDLVKRNQERYGTDKIEFRCCDIAKDDLPKVDVILCRDCWVHFSSRDIMAALKNFKRSGSMYLLATTFTQRSSNVDIVTGDWRPLNLQAAPFNFPEPVKLIKEWYAEDGGRYLDKHLALWRLKDINVN